MNKEWLDRVRRVAYYLRRHKYPTEIAVRSEDRQSLIMENASESSLQLPRCIVTAAKTNKGKLMLTIDGYQFQLKSFNSKKTMKFWRCSNRLCGVILHTTLTDEFVRFSGSAGEHCHLPNPAETEVRALRESMREKS